MYCRLCGANMGIYLNGPVPSACQYCLKKMRDRNNRDRNKESS